MNWNELAETVGFEAACAARAAENEAKVDDINAKLAKKAAERFAERIAKECARRNIK